MIGSADNFQTRSKQIGVIGVIGLPSLLNSCRHYLPEFPVKIYPTRNMGEEDEKSGEEAGKFGKKYAFQKARSRLKYNLSYFGGERDGKYHPAACWKIHISL